MTTLRNSTLGHFLMVTLLLSVSMGASVQEHEPSGGPSAETVLRQARVLYVESHTAFLNASLLEAKLMEHKDFARLGLGVSRNAEDADVFLEVERSVFTTRFTYRLVEPRTRRILAAGEASSLFGTASGRIAKRVLRLLSDARK